YRAMRQNGRKYTVLWGVTAMLILALGACKKELPNQPEPPKPQPKTEQYRVSVLLLTSEQVAKKEQGLEYSEPVELDRAVLSGSFGEKEKGQKATVTIQPKEGYILKGIYFAYDKGQYPGDQFPTGPEKAIRDKNEIEVAVQGNLKVITILDEEPYVQQSYTKNVLVNESYWKEQNQKAWNMIYPNIRKEDYNTTKRWMERVWPNMRNLVKTDTIYTEEPTVMAWALRTAYLANSKEVKSNEILYRVAYALADQSGNIVEIYPPAYWDTCPGAIQGTVVFPTVPEGEYQERVLVNLVGEKEWYDLPILEMHAINNLPNNPKVFPAFDTYYYKLFKPGVKVYKWGEVMDQKDLWTSDKVRIRKVIRRNSQDALPVPRWSKPKMYSSTTPSPQTKLIYLETGLGAFYYARETKSIELEITNGCNQRMKGEIVCVVRQKHWHDQNLDDLDYAQRKLKEVMETIDPVGYSQGEYEPNNLVLWEVELGRASVSIKPSADGEVAVIPCDGTLVDKYPSPRLMTNLNSDDFTFYWVPEGSAERFFMMQANHKALNLQEKSSIPWDGWFIGSYTDPSMGHTNQIVLQRSLYDGGEELGNRVNANPRSYY
ncbi:MAG: hypothetical protein PUG74_05035, partial [Prevotellaceae bacterium]|nr:hypothetical protein [Prevotellaceae bacterium]